MNNNRLKKIIFMTVYDGLIAKNHLRTKVFPLLREHVRFVLFCPADKFGYYQKEFGADDVVIEKSPRPTHPKIESVFWTLSFHSIPTMSVWNLMQRQYVQTGKKRKAMHLLKITLHYLGHIKAWRQLMRFFYRLMPDHSFDALIETYKPDLIFAPNLVSDEDMRLLKAAQRKGIKNIGMMKSWDNIDTKAYVSMHPDIFMSQNEVVKSDIVNLVDYPESNVRLVGFPQFDIYADRSKIIPREEFLRSLGLDPAKKTILYAAAGDMLAPRDPQVIEGLAESIMRGELGDDVQVLLRPHPKYVNHEESFKKYPFIIVDRPGRYIKSDNYSSWEFDQNDIIHLMNSFTHADVIVNTASTTCIEAGIFDLPIVSIAFDGTTEEPEEISVRRFYEFGCIRTLMDTGGVAVAHSHAELVSRVREYLIDRTRDKEGRKRIREVECWKLDGRAADRIAEEIINYLEKGEQPKSSQ